MCADSALLPTSFFILNFTGADCGVFAPVGFNVCCPELRQKPALLRVLRNSPRAMPLFGLPIIVKTALYTSRKQGKLQLACVCGNPEIYVYETKKLTNLFIEAGFLNSRCQYLGAKLFLLLCVGFQFVRSCHRDCSSMSRIRFVIHLFPLPISESRRSNCL